MAAGSEGEDVRGCLSVVEGEDVLCVMGRMGRRFCNALRKSGVTKTDVSMFKSG